MFKELADVMGRPAMFPLPQTVVKMLFGKERMVLLTTGAKIKPEKAIKLGFTFRYPTISAACKKMFSKY